LWKLLKEKSKRLLRESASICEVAIITKNPYFYYKVIEELKKAEIEYLTIDFSQKIPAKIKVVITSKEEREKVNFPIVLSGDAREVIEECLRILKPKKYNQLIIGIDPGLRPGIAVLGDGKVVETKKLSSPESIEKTLKDILKRSKAEEIVVRVGRGGGVYQSRILKLLQENFPYKIEIVDERKTTPTNKSKKEIIAAINIAIKEGRLLKEKIEVSPTKGEIKELQRQSRLLSKEITISRELAEQVAKGDISLEEAIKLMKTSRKSRGFAEQ